MGGTSVVVGISNRELATVSLLSVVLVWGLTQREIRASFAHVVEAFLRPKLLLPLMLYAAYITGCVWVASRLGLWERELLKDTALWFLVSGVALLLNIDRTSKDEHFFANTARATVAWSVFVGFFINIVSFGFPVELGLQASIAMLSVVVVVPRTDKSYAPAKRACEVLLYGIGFALAAVTVAEIIQHRQELDGRQLGQSLALTIWLPLAALPFVYGFALFAVYELAFMRMGFANWRQRPNLRTRAAVVLGLHGHLRDVHAFGGGWTERAASAPSFRDALRHVRDFRRQQAQRRRKDQEREDRLRRYAGVEGAGADGKRLDQREFAGTKDALRWLAVCHMGWYRNSGGRYQADLLERLGGFSSKGLPAEHGVVMEVRGDGQAWYAWRRTVGGWVFAIGAAAKPSDQWFYDGKEPPSGFPSVAGGWAHFAPGDVAVNW